MHFLDRITGSTGFSFHPVNPVILSKVLPLLISVLCLSGCGTLWTSKGQYLGADQMLARGDFAAAKAQIESRRYLYSPTKDRVLYLLDLGMLQHYLGDYEASNISLDEAERAMDDAFVKSISRGAASLLFNDNALTYAGEDYENVYVNAFKALNYLALDEFDKAFVEIRRIDEKLKVLESRYWKIAQKYDEASELDEPFRVGKNRFQNSTLGRWISLQIYRAEGRMDEAAIDLKKIELARNLQPDISPATGANLTTALRPAAAGTVKVPILSLIGQPPKKRADTFWIHTQLNQIFIAASQERRVGGQRLSGATVIVWPGVEPGYTFKFQLPTLEKRGTRVSSATVFIDGQRGPRLEPLESLENAAEAAFEIQKPLTYLKTVSRTVTKGIAAAQAQRAAAEKWGEPNAWIAGLLAGIGVSVTENADLRISRFFPAEAYTAELELSPGIHQIAVVYFGANGTVLYTDNLGAVEIRRSGVNLIESFYLN